MRTEEDRYAQIMQAATVLPFPVELTRNARTGGWILTVREGGSERAYCARDLLTLKAMLISGDTLSAKSLAGKEARRALHDFRTRLQSPAQVPRRAKVRAAF